MGKPPGLPVYVDTASLVNPQTSKFPYYVVVNGKRYFASSPDDIIKEVSRQILRTLPHEVRNTEEPSVKDVVASKQEIQGRKPGRIEQFLAKSVLSAPGRVSSLAKTTVKSAKNVGKFTGALGRNIGKGVAKTTKIGVNSFRPVNRGISSAAYATQKAAINAKGYLGQSAKSANNSISGTTFKAQSKLINTKRRVTQSAKSAAISVKRGFKSLLTSKPVSPANLKAQEAITITKSSPNASVPTNAYRVFGFTPGQPIPKADLKSKYKRLALARHPNRGGTAEAFQELGAAYQELLKVAE